MIITCQPQFGILRLVQKYNVYLGLSEIRELLSKYKLFSTDA